MPPEPWESWNQRVTTKAFVNICHEDAVLPKQSDDDVGYDIHSVEDVRIPPGETRCVSTGLKMAIGMYHPSRRTVPFFKIEGRSGMAAKHGVFPIGGIIDPSYRGEIKAILHNGSKSPFIVEKGDRIAQLVCYLTLANNQEHTMVFEECDWQKETKRSDKGFGSSGK